MKAKPTRCQSTWPSPISSAMVARQATALDQPHIDADTIYWIEGRSEEGGRSVVVRANPDGSRSVLTPPPFNIRSRVHEYGGGSFRVQDGTLYASNFSDNRVYAFAEGSAPLPLTHDSHERFGDFVLDRSRGRLIAVREHHRIAGQEPSNSLVAIALDGSGRIDTLCAGSDFYSSPSLAPDGLGLAWLSWNHPLMPWNGTQLWTAAIAADGSLVEVRCRAGGSEESLFQPSFAPDGRLYVVSDRTGWWNLYRVGEAGLEPVSAMEAEFGRPQWNLGMSTYGFIDSDHVLAAYIEAGSGHLVKLDLRSGGIDHVDLPYTEIDTVRVGDQRAVLLAGSPSIPYQIVAIHLTSEETEVLATGVQTLPDAAYLSIPKSVTYPSGGRTMVHAFYYPPANRDHALADEQAPPLIVMSHGGPTSRATNVLKLANQFWTSRGFAVLDVNYRGSSGFGRGYRDALAGGWGLVDVEDCIAGALFLTHQGLADPQRLAIRGGSAGGFTTLCALTFHHTFHAGASYYGVSDLEALDHDTHKFESRYTSHLLAEAPQRVQLYRERSPIHHLDQLACPVIFFQGLDDKVVPPAQSEVMVAALRARGVPVAYLGFEGEGHGFRRAENIERSLEAELYFYCEVFGLTLAESIRPVQIDNR